MVGGWLETIIRLIWAFYRGNEWINGGNRAWNLRL